MRAHIAFAAGALLLAATPADAGKKKVKANLTCGYQDSEGNRYDLAKGKHRIEQIVRCMVVMTSPVEGMRYKSTQRVTVKKGKESVTGKVRNGDVAYWTDYLEFHTARFYPEGIGPDMDSGAPSIPDFVPCLDFIVEADIRDEKDKVVWSKKMKIKADCPD